MQLQQRLEGETDSDTWVCCRVCECHFHHWLFFVFVFSTCVTLWPFVHGRTLMTSCCCCWLYWAKWAWTHASSCRPVWSCTLYCAQLSATSGTGTPWLAHTYLSDILHIFREMLCIWENWFKNNRNAFYSLFTYLIYLYLYFQLARICQALTDLTEDHHNMCLLVQLLPHNTRGK